MTHEVGTRLRLGLTVRDASGALVDPTTDVTLDVQAPSGAVASYAWQGAGTVVRESLGTFAALVTLSEAGVWSYSWATSGTYVVTRSGRVEAVAALVEPGSGDPPAEDPGTPAPTVYTLETDVGELVTRVGALEGKELAWSMPLVVSQNGSMTYDGPAVSRLAIPRAASGHVVGAAVDLVIPAGAAAELAYGEDLNVSGAALDPSRPYLLTVVCVADGYLRGFGAVLEARDATAPTLEGARVEYAAADVLALTLSEPCAVVDADAVTIDFVSGTPRTVVGVASDGGTEVLLTLSGAVAASDVLTVSIGAGAIIDLNGNALAPVVAEPVVNDVGDVVFPNTVIALTPATLGSVGASIATWADESGEGNDFPAAGVGAEPVVTDDGSILTKFARFNGSTQWLKRSAAILLDGAACPDVDAFTLLFVARIRSGTNAMLASYTDSGGTEFSWAALLREIGALYGTVDDAVTGRASVADASTAWRVLAFVQESLTERKLYADGVLVASSSGVSKNPSALAFGSIGCAYTGSPPGSGYPAALDVAEHRVVLSGLTPQQVADFGAYSLASYGVS